MKEANNHDNALQLEDDSPLVDQILDEALNAVRSGREVSLASYTDRYPELASELRLLLPAMLLMEAPGHPISHSGSRILSRDAHPRKAVDSPELTPPVLTDYAIVSEIGRGAMGVVYEAIQIPLKRSVALKVLFQSAMPSEKYRQRFLREAEIAARLHHTNIVPVFEAGESEGCCFYAMQLIEGQNLLQIIESATDDIARQSDQPTLNSRMPSDDTMTHADGQSGQPRQFGSRRSSAVARENLILLPEACARIALQVAEGLHFAHLRGILHRDIKPSNIIIDSEDRAWIADFGLAKANDDSALTDANDVVGTIRYLAPERFQGKCDLRSDIYALGVTLYEMLHKQPFWSNTDRIQLVQQIINNRIGSGTKRAYRCPKDLQRIIEKATDFEPSQRYTSAGDLADDLRRFLNGQPVSARRASLFRKTYLLAKRNPVIFALTTLLLLMATGTAIVTASLSYRASSLSAESLKNFESARRSLGFLLATIDKVCLSIGQDQRLNRPEFQELRQQLLQMVIDFNHQFDEVPEVAGEMRFLSAKAHVRLGSMTSGDDTLAESAGYLESARHILQEMHRSAPNRDEVSMELARCLRETALVEWKMGIRQSALERNAQAIRLCEDLQNAEGFEDEADMELARNRLALGGFLSESEPSNDSETHYIAAIELLERLRENHPQVLSYTVELGHANRQQGSYYLANLRSWRKAEAPLARAAELYEIADRNEPGNPSLIANRAYVIDLQAKLSYIGGNRIQAVEQLNQACRLLADLVKVHGNVAGYRAQYAKSLQRLAEYQITQNWKDPTISENLENAAEEFLWLIAYDPNQISYKKGLISTKSDQAEICSRYGNWQNAMHCLDAAASILVELEFLRPTDRFVQDQTHFVICRQAEMLANLNRFDESLEAWDRAIALAPDWFREINRIGRLRTVVLSGGVISGVEELEKLLEGVDENTKGRQHHLGQASRIYAVAHRQAAQLSADQANQRLGEMNMQVLAEEYATRAIELLGELASMNMLDPEVTKSDADYSSLIDRPDFQEIIKAVQQRQ